MKRILSLFLCAVLLCFCAGGVLAESGESDVIIEEIIVDSPSKDEIVTEKDGWHFNAKGFLVGDNPGEEYLLEDEKNGVWQYATADLSITITRYQETVKVKAGKRIREHYIADIQASETSPLFTITTPPTKTRPAGYTKKNPAELVKKNPVVLAISDDYYGHRMQSRDKGTAKWPDGIIIRNGEINEKGVDSSKSYMYNTAQYSDSRIAIGMIEPYHYLVLMARGRPDTKYIGMNFDLVAHRMLELGCTEALNLDGGGTACMVFNGKVLVQGDKSARPLGSMIAFGAK